MNKFVIASGWSAGQLISRPLNSHGEIFGVNDSALWWMPYVDVAVTMDRLWFEHRWAMLKNRGIKEVFVREKCDCNVKREPDDYWKTFTHFKRPGLTMEPGILHGANSGICAINLAYQRMSEGDNLFLIGFDMCKGPAGEAYWYAPYPWAPKPVAHSKPGYYRDWVKDFDGIAKSLYERKINVFNVNDRSMVKNFPVINLKQMRAMLND